MHLLLRTFLEVSDYISFSDRDNIIAILKHPVISELIDRGMYHRNLVFSVSEYIKDSDPLMLFIKSEIFHESYDQYLYYLENPRHLR